MFGLASFVSRTAQLPRQLGLMDPSGRGACCPNSQKPIIGSVLNDLKRVD
jgi:hypothetical protein